MMLAFIRKRKQGTLAVIVTCVATLWSVAGSVVQKAKQASTTVSAAHSEADTPAISEMTAGVELERKMGGY